MSRLPAIYRHLLALSLFLPVSTTGLAEDQDTSTSLELPGNKPLLEVGVGGFTGYLPDYPAAGQNTMRYIAAPYVIYRGDFLRIGGEENRGAVSGRFLKSDRYELDLSLSAAFPVDSGSNKAREGMPDLDFLLGIGPQLRFKMINEPDQRRLNLNLQVRAVFSTDFSSIEGQGYVFNPKLNYTHYHVSPLDLRFFASAGPVFATEKLMGYFYDVDPEFVTPSRPAYEADAGYLGSSLTLSVRKRFNSRFRLFLGTHVDAHHGATNRDSPLYKEDYNFGVFAAFAWSFYQSEELAKD